MAIAITTACVSAQDLAKVEPDLVVPTLSDDGPAAGRRFVETLPAYEGTAVHHVVYLPTDWSAEKRWPVVVEYAGNGPFGTSTGRVEDAKLGYGVTGGRGCIWVVLPFVSGDGKSNVRWWWGDKPTYDVGPTVAYCKLAVPAICAKYGGDPRRVVLSGFSRGAIACHYVGLHDDEIARLWRGFVLYSHYDGVNEHWPYPAADRTAALVRLKRLNGRPEFICAEETDSAANSIDAVRRYLAATGVEGDYTFASTGYREHDDAWALRPGDTRRKLRAWLRRVLEQGKPGVDSK
ncbi:MAG: hypothetical protein GC159_08895 [Phycisphaera sp.]|nr:hypothetical protein [Phycisphaera sp.]